MSSQDDPKAKPRFENFGRKLDAEFGETAEKLEREKEKVITYLNNEVVPAIRTHSTKALRLAAEQLSKLAEFMDKNRSSS
jgi:translation initiation factor 2 beta subunit (eIF-2beta)/eIF-5